MAEQAKPNGNGSQLDPWAFSGKVGVQGFCLNTETVAGTSRQGKPYHLQKTTLLCGKQVVVITDAKRGDGPIPEVPKEGQSCRFTIEPSMEDKGILNLNGRMLEG